MQRIVTCVELFIRLCMSYYHKDWDYEGIRSILMQDVFISAPQNLDNEEITVNVSWSVNATRISNNLDPWVHFQNSSFYPDLAWSPPSTP